MGKLKSRLAQVMPHVWFYKLKEKGKPGSHGTHKKLSSQHKLVAVRSTVPTKGGRAIYTSPVNHKASDIHFPETPTRKTSPLIQGVKAEQEEGSSTGFIDMSPYSDSIRAAGLATDAAPCNSSSEPKNTYEKRRFHLDVRELEQRLKALSYEDRRKYYKSPMFSVALPSPNIHNDGSHPLHDGASRPLLYESVNFLLGNVANHGGNPYLSDGAFSQDSGDLGFFSLNTSFGENDSNAAIGIFEESKSLEGSRSCSTSFRKSTSSSSSDTGFERASSSLWERDLSSLTSEGSDQHLFTHIEDRDNAWLHHRSSSAKSRHKKKRCKDKKAYSMSVLMSFKEGYEGCRIDNGFLNRQDGMCKCRECSERGLLLSKQSAIEEETNSRGSRLSYADNWQTYEAVSQKPSSGSLLKYEDCSLPMAKGAMDGHKGHRRVSSNEFSHFESREIRSLEQPSDSAHSESELETLSKNYRRFKQLQQTGHLRIKTMSKLQAKDDPVLSSNSKVKEGMGMINLSLPRTSSRTKPPGDNPCHTYPKSSGLSNDDQRHPNRHISEQAYEDPILFPTSRFKEELGGILSPSLSRSKSCGNHHHSGRLGSEEPWTSDDNQANTEEGSNRDTGRGHEGKRSAGKDSKVLDSFAIVKCSYDPKKDFKESMMDMIVEKELRSSVELVELLQCYLSLNSERYHGTIVRVFSEVWSELFH